MSSISQQLYCYLYKSCIARNNLEEALDHFWTATVINMCREGATDAGLVHINKARVEYEAERVVLKRWVTMWPSMSLEKREQTLESLHAKSHQ